MISTSQLKQMLSEAGEDAKLTDLAFVILSRYIEDPIVIYRLLYNNRESQKSSAPAKLMELPKMKSLVKAFESACPVKVKAEKPKKEEIPATPVQNNGDLSYDEIKSRLEEELRILTDIRNTKADELDAKEYAALSGRIADIIIKLKDKFGTVEQKKEQRVIVQQKYDTICPYCHREIAVNPRND